jgi:hypothetical protein
MCPYHRTLPSQTVALRCSVSVRDSWERIGVTIMIAFRARNVDKASYFSVTPQFGAIIAHLNTRLFRYSNVFINSNIFQKEKKSCLPKWWFYQLVFCILIKFYIKIYLDLSKHCLDSFFMHSTHFLKLMFVFLINVTGNKRFYLYYFENFGFLVHISARHHTIPIFVHQMLNSTNYVSSVMLRPKNLEIRNVMTVKI